MKRISPFTVVFFVGALVCATLTALWAVDVMPERDPTPPPLLTTIVSAPTDALINKATSMENFDVGQADVGTRSNLFATIDLRLPSHRSDMFTMTAAFDNDVSPEPQDCQGLMRPTSEHALILISATDCIDDNAVTYGDQSRPVLHMTKSTTRPSSIWTTRHFNDAASKTVPAT